MQYFFFRGEGANNMSNKTYLFKTIFLPQHVHTCWKCCFETCQHSAIIKNNAAEKCKNKSIVLFTVSGSKHELCSHHKNRHSHLRSAQPFSCKSLSVQFKSSAVVPSLTSSSSNYSDIKSKTHSSSDSAVVAESILSPSSILFYDA